MTDDIVTRLRDNCACGITDEFGIVCTSRTGADEIERLREKCKQWERVAEIYCDLHDNNAGRYARENCTCYGCQAYEQQTKQQKGKHE